MSDLERAIHIAIEAHKGQKDKAGAPYILHPLRVMLRLDSDVEMMAAVLHDVVEDSRWTLKGLQEEGFPAQVIETVDYLTRRKQESYDQFIDRIKPTCAGCKNQTGGSGRQYGPETVERDYGTGQGKDEEISCCLDTFKKIPVCVVSFLK